MKLSTTNMLSIISDLTADKSNQAQADLSNSQKNFQLVQWIRESRLSELLPIIEQSIKALPAGKISTPTFNKVTGERGEKSVKYREIAKRSIQTAWKNATAENNMVDHAHTKLVFKLSMPQIEKITVPNNDIENKVARILGDSIDQQGLDVIMNMITDQVDRVKGDVVKLANEHQARQETTRLRDSIASLIQVGFTKDNAMVQIATLEDIDQQDLIEMVG